MTLREYYWLYGYHFQDISPNKFERPYLLTSISPTPLNLTSLLRTCVLCDFESR